MKIDFDRAVQDATLLIKDSLREHEPFHQFLYEINDRKGNLVIEVEGTSDYNQQNVRVSFKKE